MTFVPMNVASVQQTGRHNFSLITPYKTFKSVTSYSYCSYVEDHNCHLFCIFEQTSKTVTLLFLLPLLLLLLFSLWYPIEELAAKLLNLAHR